MERINATLEARKSGTVDANPPPANAPPPPADTETDSPINEGTQADPRENDPAYWRQRFNVMQGMLRTQQATHREAVDEKDRVLTELRDRVRALEAKGNSGSDAVDTAMFFTPEQIERFGQDQCEAMAATAIKAARQSAQQLIDSELKPIRDKAKATADNATADKEAEFWEKLAEQAPDWETVDATDAWKEWLAENDPNSGLQRQDILDRHRGALNAIGVAKLFADFKKTKDRPTPPVAPPRGAAGGANDGQPSNVPALGYPTRQETREFYTKAKLGKVTDKERAAFEARLRSKAAA